MESEEGYSPCIIDMPSGNENTISPQSYEKGIESFKTENLLTVSHVHPSYGPFLFKKECDS